MLPPAKKKKMPQTATQLELLFHANLSSFQLTVDPCLNAQHNNHSTVRHSQQGKVRKELRGNV